MSLKLVGNIHRSNPGVTESTSKYFTANVRVCESGPGIYHDLNGQPLNVDRLPFVILSSDGGSYCSDLWCTLLWTTRTLAKLIVVLLYEIHVLSLQRRTRMFALTP
jgi:hypothetical protein